MSERDVLIGKNVVRLRGPRTQQAVADAMRDRGHKWAQATVWSVEKGERPLRFTEAEDLAAVLEVKLEELQQYGPDRPAALVFLTRRVEEMWEELCQLNARFFSERERLAGHVRPAVAERDGVPVAEDLVEEARRVVGLNPVMAVELGESRARASRAATEAENARFSEWAVESDWPDPGPEDDPDGEHEVPF